MITFLSKIAQLDSVTAVILLSPQGEFLFYQQTGALASVDREGQRWSEIISDLDSPVTADLVFIKGRYYLHSTDVGYLIVGLKHALNLNKIRAACKSVQAKLIDAKVRKRVLLKMLSDGAEMTKPQLVNALIPLADAEVAHELLSVMQRVETIHPDFKEKLLLSLCKALGECSTPYVVPALNKILLTYSSNTSRTGEEIRAVVSQAIEKLVTGRQPGPGKEKPAVADTKAKKRSQAKEQSVASGDFENLLEVDSPEEQQIKELLGRNEKRQAVALVMQLIISNAREKRFQKAEKLRDWLMQIDSMALVESIRAAEIIEEEKGASISDEHLDIWKELLRTLSPAEFSALYHAMTQKKYTDGEIIVKQGDFLSSLFFVNSGHVQINTVSQGGEMLLREVGAGEIIGSDTFFELSVWTVTVASKGAFLSQLTRQRLQSQKDNCPALYAKLQEFCLKCATKGNIFSNTSRTRRKFERKKVSGRVSIDLLDQQGNDMWIVTKGELLDVSKGGVALSLRFSKKKNAAALLGQNIRVNIRPDSAAEPLLRIGKVMAVRCHDFIGNDYSLHIQFEEELSNAEIHLVVGKGR
ncbi:MAG: cyclic nucleotide-binding domain-containing protein [Pseudomonadota bacterium]